MLLWTRKMENILLAHDQGMKQFNTQECIPVGCAPPALYRTWEVSVRRGSSWTEPPLDRDPPFTETPLDRGPLDRDPLENITLPQTSFTGGKNRRDETHLNGNREDAISEYTKYRCIYTNVVGNELKSAFFLREEMVIPFTDPSKLKQ